MLNPIRNVERSLGPGGPGLEKISPVRRTHHNYPAQRRKPALFGASSRIKLQEGGEVQADAPDAQDLRVPDENLSPHDQQLKQVVVEAMMAVRGEHPDPEKAVRRFISIFGTDEFQELREMVLSSKQPGGDEEEEEEPEPEPEPEPAPAPEAAGMQVGGLLRGPGTGQSDEIEAATPSGRRVLLSDGEYVVDAPTVAALGDGSTAAGARRLDAFRKEIRRQSYGHDKQPKPLKKGGLARLMALNE